MRSHPNHLLRLLRRAVAVAGGVGTLTAALVACTLVVGRPDVVIGTGSPS